MIALAVGVTLFLGVTLALSAIAKLASPATAASSASALLRRNVPPAYVRGLSAIEGLLGIGMLVGSGEQRRVACSGAFLLLAVMFLVTVALYRRNLGCGCFGRLSSGAVTRVGVIQSGALTLLAPMSLFGMTSGSLPVSGQAILVGALLGVAFVLPSAVADSGRRDQHDEPVSSSSASNNEPAMEPQVTRRALITQIGGAAAGWIGLLALGGSLPALATRREAGRLHSHKAITLLDREDRERLVSQARGDSKLLETAAVAGVREHALAWDAATAAIVRRQDTLATVLLIPTVMRDGLIIWTPDGSAKTHTPKGHSIPKAPLTIAFLPAARAFAVGHPLSTAPMTLDLDDKDWATLRTQWDDSISPAFSSDSTVIFPKVCCGGRCTDYLECFLAGFCQGVCYINYGDCVAMCSWDCFALCPACGPLCTVPCNNQCGSYRDSCYDGCCC